MSKFKIMMPNGVIFEREPTTVNQDDIERSTMGSEELSPISMPKYEFDYPELEGYTLHQVMGGKYHYLAIKDQAPR